MIDTEKKEERVLLEILTSFLQGLLSTEIRKEFLVANSFSSLHIWIMVKQPLGLIPKSPASNIRSTRRLIRS